MSLNALLNVGGIIAGLIPLTEIHTPTNPEMQTSIAIGVGSGGSVPHVAVWGEDGYRITQFTGDPSGHICTSETWQSTADNRENGMRPATPTYVSVVMQENDAICVASVVASGNGQQYVWSGDLAYTCGAQWMESKYTTAGSNTPMRCAWIDHDHTNNIIARGISMHIRDFTADAGLVAQYQNNTDRLCKNSNRLTFQPAPIVPDSVIGFFNPPLEYSPNEDPDPTGPSTAGALTMPDEGIDRKTSGYPDNIDMNPGKHNKRHSRNFKRSKVQGVKNLKPGTLVVSHFPQHSAKEMCEHPMSLGPDFVSVEESVYCDMETAKWWPLCDATHVKDCFDLGTQSLKVDGPSKRDDVPLKQYTKHEEWGLTHEKRALLPRKTAPGDRCNPRE